MDLSNRICSDQTLHGEQAYVYGLKARALRHHCLGYGTFSVDMGRLETLRKRYSRLIRPITYLPLYIKATALAVQRNPEANAVLFRKLFGLKVVQFERVDVNLPVTRRIGDRWVTFIGTVRDAAAKPLSRIQDELAEYERCPPEQSLAIRRFERLSRMPFWLAQLVHWRMTWSPEFYARSVGTCGLTLLKADWGEHLFPIAPTSVVFGIGAARREPVVRGEEIVIGRLLRCTLMVDNFVVSGLTGARLARDFQELLESGSFIIEELRHPSREPHGAGSRLRAIEQAPDVGVLCPTRSVEHTRRRGARAGSFSFHGVGREDIVFLKSEPRLGKEENDVGGRSIVADGISRRS